ncbi:hypothetical protein V1280_003436 [Bradyrhizobium sp. AZCC 2230]
MNVSQGTKLVVEHPGKQSKQGRSIRQPWRRASIAGVGYCTGSMDQYFCI